MTPVKRKCSYCLSPVTVKAVEFDNTYSQFMKVTCPRCGTYTFYELHEPKFTFDGPVHEYCSECGEKLDTINMEEQTPELGNHETRITCPVCFALNPVYVTWRI